MKIKKYYYSKELIFFSILLLLVLMSGCNGGVSPTDVLFGSINVDSTPHGAKVYLDGVDTGKVTPTVLTNIDPGDHIIELRKFHYMGSEEAVTVIAGQTVYVDLLLDWAPEDSVTIQPDGLEGKDAYVINAFPSDNYGDNIYLLSGIYTIPSARSYLQFNLSSVPPEAVILDANLGLYFYSSYGLTFLSLGLYEVTESWAENTITWDSQPASSSEAVDIQIIPASQTNDFVYWQIGDLVKGWQEGSIANYGMQLKDTGESSDDGGVDFFSSDWSTANQRPKLIIEFYIP